jgi:putative FmdB family regulatory protein
MPIYEYTCDTCKRTFEVKQSMSDSKFTSHDEVTEGHYQLPDVCKGKITRLIGTGNGFIFKGPGFYATDYPKESKC